VTTAGSGDGAPRVLLIGMMGAGKSTIGRAIEARTGWPYVDNDELVQRANGRTAPDVLAESGETGLRRAESLALGAALAMPLPVVAGIAAGVVLDSADLERLRTGGFVVWLRARLSTLAVRVGSGEGRSWLGSDPLAALTRLYDGRAERYAAAASLVVDVDDRTPEDIAALVVAQVTGAGARQT
jgi:shikimate kinase